MFKNKVFNYIFTFIYYAAFIAAALVILFKALADVQTANQNDAMSLLVSIAALGAPLFLFLAAEVLKNRRILRILFSVIGNVLIFLCGGLSALCAFNGSGSGEQLYQTLCLSSVLASTVTLALYNLISGMRENEEKALAYNILKILVFLTPFISYLAAFLLLKYLPLAVAFAIVGAIFIVAAALSLGGDLWGGKLFTGLCALAFIVFSIVLGVQSKDGGLNYSANPFHTLVFLPILTAVAMILLAITQSKFDVQNDVYLLISRAIIILALPALQYLIAVKWWIGLIVVVVALIILMCLDDFFGERRHKKKSGKYEDDLWDGLESMLNRHMVGSDHCSVLVLGAENYSITVDVYYTSSSRARDDYYRKDILHWIDNFMRSYPGAKSWETTVRFNNNF